jgi:hypothetical protein
MEAEEAWLPIMGADSKPFVGSDGEQFKIKIAGPTHSAGFRADEALRLRVLKQMTNQTGVETIAEDYIARVLEPLVLRTLDWTPISQGDQLFVCNEENARRLYRQSDLVRKQVEGFIYRAENFQPKPSGS